MNTQSQPLTLSLEQSRRRADSSIAHARTCKKDLSDCKQCKAAIGFYGGLPLDTLALVLQDRPTLKPAK